MRRIQKAPQSLTTPPSSFGQTDAVVMQIRLACRRASERLPRSSNQRGLDLLAFVELTLICGAQNEQDEPLWVWAIAPKLFQNATSRTCHCSKWVS
jgi:hypothetical protein